MTLASPPPLRRPRPSRPSGEQPLLSSVPPIVGRLSDAELLARSSADPTAFAELYRRHAAAVFGLAGRVCGPAQADTVAQDAFISLWRGRAAYRAERGSVRSWLLEMTRDRAIGERRRTRTQERHRDSDARFALGALPPGQREILELAYFEGLAPSEIAARLSLPLHTTRSGLRLAIEHLRSGLLGEPGHEPRVRPAA
jgi:RNA polymerase sigma-70 factor (ECF subfamily)